MKRLLLPLALLLSAALPVRGEDDGRPAYPETRAGGHTVRLHGMSVADPYRWLEDDDDEQVIAWDEAQMELVRRRLDGFPGRRRLQERLDAEFALGGMKSLPRFRGAFRWYTYRPRGKNQPILYRTDSGAKQTPKAVIDPNRWSKDGTAGMKAWKVSPDGRYVAYRRDEEGSEDTTLYVIDANTGRHLPESITRTKFSSITWTADSKGFFYNRMPDPGSVPKGEDQYHSRIYYHALGTLVLDDPMVYGRGRPMLEDCWLGRSEDDEHMFLSRGMPYRAVETFECTWQDGTLALTPLIVGEDERTWIDRVGDTYVLNTDRNTGNREVFLAKRTAEGALGPWEPVALPRGKTDVVKDVWAVGGKRLLVHMKANVISRLYVRPLAGGPVREVKLPGRGTVGRVATRPEDTRVWFTFESYDRPATIFRCDLAAEDLVLEAEDKQPTTVDVEALVATQTTYESKDGTAIPLFLLHRKDVKLDGKAPTILYGYGGFRIGLFPRFSRTWGLWADMGGVLAVACLRGGSEFGEAWHQAGCLGNKQNVFDDFIAAGDWLVESGKASREKLAIQGGSNGGLLVAVTINQRPDLCNVAVCGVPLTDMLRYHEFQYAKSWTKEYGDPDVAEEFAWIRPYSPYHNVKPATAYPAVPRRASAIIQGPAATSPRVGAARASPEGERVAARLNAPAASGLRGRATPVAREEEPQRRRERRGGTRATGITERALACLWRRQEEPQRREGRKGVPPASRGNRGSGGM